jgi:hypothetical protein
MPHDKRAADDVSESTLEQNFADLANARLRDKAPELMDYQVGFQLLKSDDDGTRAVGIFGFQIDTGWYYTAVFFLNGSVKGLDSIYSVDSDMFMPLTEDWVSSIINKRPNRLGEADTQNRYERGTRLPNYVRMWQIPGGVGNAGNGIGLGGSLSKLGEAMLTPRDDGIPGLPEILAAQPVLAQGFVNDLARYPKLAAVVSQFYNFTDFSAPPMAKTAADDQVTIISSIAQPGADKLTDTEKEQLVAGGTAVVDKRPDTVKSITYKSDTKHILQNPAEGGLYEVLMADGSIKDLFCLRVLGSVEKYLVVDVEDDRHGMVESECIWAVRQYEPAVFRERLEKASEKPSDVRPRDCLVFVALTGDTTLGFEIESVTGGTDEIKALKVKSSYYIPGGSSNMAWDRHVTGPAMIRYDQPETRIREVLVAQAGSAAIRYYNKQLIVNDGRFRALVLDRAGKDGYGYDREWDSKILCAKDFGDYQTVRVSLQKVACEVSVEHLAGRYVIGDGQGKTAGSEADALRTLLVKHGCTVDDARSMLAEACQTPVSYWVHKTAAQMLDIPPIFDRSESGEMSSYHPTEVPTSAVDQATPEENYQYYQYNSPFAGYSDDESPSGEAGHNGKSVKDTLGAAAQSGQREVFDASVLMSLAKTNNPTGLVEKWLPNMVSGMDRLGRTLFLLHYQFDEFKAKYGAKDMVDFADNLTSCFEDLGAIVLTLRQHSLAGDPAHFGLGIGGEDNE